MIVFHKKRLKTFSRRGVIAWILFTIFTVLFVVELFNTPERILARAKEQTIEIEEIQHRRSGYRVGRFSTDWLRIESDDVRYHADYRRLHYDDYRVAIEEDLLSGNVKTLTVLAASGTGLDKLRNIYSVLSMENDDTVYYPLEIGMKSLRADYIGVVMGAVCCIPTWLILTSLAVMSHGVISFKRGKRKN